MIVTGSGAYSGVVHADTQAKVVGLLTSAEVNLAPPRTGEAPQSLAQIVDMNSHADYQVLDISWIGELTEGKFKAGTVYSATLTLESQNTKAFVPTESLFTAMVPGATSIGPHETDGIDVGNTVTFTVTFPETGP